MVARDDYGLAKPATLGAAAAARLGGIGGLAEKQRLQEQALGLALQRNDMLKEHRDIKEHVSSFDAALRAQATYSSAAEIKR